MSGAFEYFLFSHLKATKVSGVVRFQSCALSDQRGTEVAWYILANRIVSLYYFVYEYCSFEVGKESVLN